jgi:hypothetical protein
MAFGGKGFPINREEVHTDLQMNSEASQNKHPERLKKIISALTTGHDL